VWSFDLGYLYPHRSFGPKPLKIYHPVDEPLDKRAVDAASGADYIFSITREILEKYRAFSVPKTFLHHGVADHFFMPSPDDRRNDRVRVGFSGNLLRNDIDRPTFLKIIKANPSVSFECWGSYTTAQSNIGGGENLETNLFIDELKHSPMLCFMGPFHPSNLPWRCRSWMFF